MTRLLRYFLPLYLAAYVFAAFVYRSLIVWKRSGVNPIVFKASDDAHDFIGRVLKVLFGLLVAVVFTYSLLPSIYEYSVPILWLEHVVLKWLGLALLLLSLVWIVLAQAQMGESWRIGIDSEHRTPLVQVGVFRLSRNPIFLGMIITLLGLFLIIPNAVTLLVVVLGTVIIQIQVRLEEQFLAMVHGDDYEEYRRRVRRWL
jgi:protein-S-isoprenylcysteine O-methyltransferase Ste14